MKIYLIGIGTDGCRTLTAEAADAIRTSDLLIGASRMLEPFRGSGKTCISTYQTNEIAKIIMESHYKSVSVLFSGDTGFFSGAKALLAQLTPDDVTIIPGISSAAAFCAKIGKSYEKMHFLSLHGVDSNIAIQTATHPLCFFLLGGKLRVSDLCRRLCDYHMSQIKVYIGQNLGYPNEKIISGSAAEFLDFSDDTLTVMGTENPAYLDYLPSAIPDQDFIRSQIPMTKSQIRCIITALLHIRRHAVCWDVGCGTGSVSVEMAHRCPDGTVYAFDKNPEAVKLTMQNAKKFFCDNICAAEGLCPDILKDAAVPDFVFIGGSCGNLPGIFRTIAEKNPAAEILVSAVSLESLAQASDCFAQNGISPDIVQIAVTNTRKIGNHTMLDAQNPVFLIWGRLQCGEL